MKKLTILTDVDDVMWDLVGAWCAKLNQLYHRNVTLEDITEWDMTKAYPGIPFKFLTAVLHDADFWKTVRPMPDAVCAITRLIADGHKLCPLTATHYQTAPPKLDRLLENFTMLKWEDIIISHDKSLMLGDIMIDDYPLNLESAQHVFIRMLFDRPHNRSYDAAAHGMIRVKTWKEIYGIISHMAQEE